MRQSEKLIYYILFCILAVFHLSVGGQNTAEYYYQVDEPWHKLFLYGDGTFKEFETNWLNNYICRYGINISKGTYKKESHFFVLESDVNWFLPDTFFLNGVIANKSNTDSLTIVIDSPYEQMFDLEENNNICTYFHHRVYLYAIQLQCGSDSLNKSFEKDFNARHSADSVGCWVIFCPQSIEVHRIEVKVYWSNEFDKMPHNSHEKVFVFVPTDCQQRHFTMELPWQADYFLLTRKSYRNQKVSRLNKKTIIHDGKKYKRMRY